MDIEKMISKSSAEPTEKVEKPVEPNPKGENDGDQGEKKQDKTFTQEEVNKMIEKRLARAKHPDDYDDLREIAADLEAYGFVGTVAEKKAAIKAAKAKAKADRELEEIKAEAEKTGHSPEILKKLKDAEKEAKEAKGKLKKLTDEEEKRAEAKQAEQKQEDDWKRQYNEFVEKHSDIDVDELIKDKKFLKFAKKHTGELNEIYEDYEELMAETSNSLAEKFKRSESRSTGGGKSSPASGAVKLDSNQQKTLDDWNRRYPHMKMTPQEFLKK